MKLVTITGPHGAGKDSVIKEVIHRFEQKHPSKVKRALFLTTRQARADEVPGMDVLLATENEFNELLDKGELAYSVQMADYLVGTTWQELEKWENLLVNITFEGAQMLKEKFKQHNGKIYMIALNASPEERKQRMLEREPGLTAADAEKRMAADPRNGLEQNYSEFDLVVENPQGQFEKTVQTIMQAAEKFFNS